MSLSQSLAILKATFLSSFVPGSLQFLLYIAPIFLMVLLAIIFWDLWVDYVQGKQFLGLKYTVLELKLPKDTFKSPKAMETVLNTMNNTSGENWFSMFWKGETRPWYSLEIVSIEGQVKFFIWTEDRRKIGIMSALYSQYPEIEITENGDYSKSVHFDSKTMKLWCGEFIMSNKNPAYPIKTYVDYGLDKDPKEEFKVDPMLPQIEFLGSVPPNQQIWIQIMIRGHKKEQHKPGTLFGQTDAWKDAAKKEINEILLRDPKTKVSGAINPDTGYAKLPSITEGERELVAAIERRIGKLAFDVGVRAIYVAPKDTFDTPFGVGGIISSFSNYRWEHMSGFKPNGDKWHFRFTYPWQDYKNLRRNRYSRLGLMAYKLRSYFYGPFKGKPFVLNSEELATIYHFPGSVSQTPSLDRIPSKKAQAPGNLPV
ncbi:MAG: hypothetical protein WCT02_02450 [Candidatus Paceibacterota bacterium]